MWFNSFVFLVFITLFFALWQHFRRTQTSRWQLLTVASFIFYGWWDWRFCFLLLGSGLVDFYAAQGMQRHPQHRRLLLWLSMVVNLGALATFKYLGFFTASINQAFSAMGWHGAIPIVELALPVGISFYTFQSMSYTIDVYRGQMLPTRSLCHFFAYLSMFPQLVAGPIVRAKDMLPQLLQLRSTGEWMRWDGLKLITLGFFKKLVLADNLAPIVNAAFDANNLTPSMPYWWVIITMFAFQIYYDFSGYSDIARGLSKWMGLELPLNFERPYAATSLREFWSRWHISLSTWFRDYVYIPLGGSRDGQAAAHRNMWITMLLSGLWHGAAWNFVIWGALHALYLSLERLWHWPEKLNSLPAGRCIAWLALILQVWIGWVFFRATSFGQAAEIVGILFNPTLIDLSPVLAISKFAILILMLAVAFETRHWFSRSWQRWSLRLPVLEPAAIAVLLTLSVYFRGPGSAFIYFQF